MSLQLNTEWMKGHDFADDHEIVYMHLLYHVSTPFDRIWLDWIEIWIGLSEAV